MSDTATAIRPPERKFDGKPKVPFKDQVKSLRMYDDGREIIIDRRVIVHLPAQGVAGDGVRHRLQIVRRAAGGRADAAR